MLSAPSCRDVLLLHPVADAQHRGDTFVLMSTGPFFVAVFG